MDQEDIRSAVVIAECLLESDDGAISEAVYRGTIRNLLKVVQHLQETEKSDSCG